MQSKVSSFSAQVQGKSWSKLVQGRKCGQLISSDEAIEKSPAQVCPQASRFRTPACLLILCQGCLGTERGASSSHLHWRSIDKELVGKTL